MTETIYCFLVPSGFDGTTLMTKMWSQCVLPTAMCKRSAMLASIRAAPTFCEMDEAEQEQDLVDNDEMAATIENKSRFIFTFDGCWEQMSAVMKNLNSEFVKEKCEGFKFAAASTMVQQPNDVGHMHSNMHAFYKSTKYLGNTTFHVPSCMEKMRNVLLESGLEKGSFQTYWKALCSLPECLARSCYPSVVMEGYRKSGIWPLDHSIIMSGWSGWSSVTSVRAKQIIDIIPELAILARKGRLFDSEIELPLRQLIDFDPSHRKADDCAINHGRCIWTNNEEVVLQYRERCSQDELEQIRKDNALMEREWRIENPLAAADEDAKYARRNLPQLPEVEVAMLAEKMTGCSNPGCTLTGTKDDRRSWFGCRKKRCRLLFCPEDNCVIMFKSHKTICTK